MHNSTENRDWTGVGYPTPSNYTLKLFMFALEMSKLLRNAVMYFNVPTSRRVFNLAKMLAGEMWAQKAFLA